MVSEYNWFSKIITGLLPKNWPKAQENLEFMLDRGPSGPFWAMRFYVYGLEWLKEVEKYKK